MLHKLLISLILWLALCISTFGQQIWIGQQPYIGGTLPMASSSVTWSNILLDNFLTAQASPLTTPRLADPGPGVWTVIQTDGTLQTTNGSYNTNQNFSCGSFLRFTTNTTAGYNKQRLITTNTMTRSGGVAMFVKFRQTANTLFEVGFAQTNSTGEPNGAAFKPSSGNLNISAPPGVTQLPNCVYPLNWDGDLAVIIRPTIGAWYLARGATLAADWSLLWVDETFTNATMSPVFDGYFSGGYIASLKVVQLGSPWMTNDWQLAIGTKASANPGDSLSGTCDGTVEAGFKAATGITNELWVRQVDSTNYFAIQVDQPNSFVRLFLVTNGVYTQVASAAQTFVNNTTYLLRATFWQSNLWVYHYYNGAWFKKISTYTTAIRPLNGTNCSVTTAATNFNYFVYRTSLPSTATPPTVNLFSYGDSRTSGSGDTGNPSGSWNGYEQYLMDGLNTNGATQYIINRIGHNGHTIHQLANEVVADLTTAVAADCSPTNVLLDVGANDYTTATTNLVAITNDFTFLLNAIHTKWPGARVGVVGLYVKATNASETNGLNAVRNCAFGLVAADSTWCFNGPDGFSYLEGGNAGATYMYDAQHPNHLGYEHEALAWRANLGY